MPSARPTDQEVAMNPSADQIRALLIRREEAAAPRPARQDKVENDAFAGFLRRAIRAFGRRVGDGDVDGLRLMLDARDQLDEAIQAAVDDLKSDRWAYSWAEIGRAAGITRTAAFDRWGKR